MRGVGGPLLCVGDLLNDLADDDHPTTPPVTLTVQPLDPSHLSRLFEENYNELIKSLERKDHSWVALMLKLCSALETADKLLHSTNSNAEFLLEKIDVLEAILQRGDCAVATARDLCNLKLGKEVPMLKADK